jgi:plastocyanin
MLALSANSVEPAIHPLRPESPLRAGVTLPYLPGDTTSPGYVPDTVTVLIAVNGTVIWTNEDVSHHTVTALDGSFNSGNMNPGSAFVFTFDTVGTFDYICQYHPWMGGTVIAKA